MKKSNNKGFSLVELIVVIAIMAVLIGVLAPQFMKYVNNSRISTDITNVDNAVQAINAELAADETLSISASDTIAGVYSRFSLSASAPAPKTKEIASDSNGFVITSVKPDGTVGIVMCGGYQLYPDPANSSDGINHKTAGLKK